jgi:hypothetical protein
MTKSEIKKMKHETYIRSKEKKDILQVNYKSKGKKRHLTVEVI